MPRTSATGSPVFLRRRFIGRLWAALWIMVVIGEVLPGASVPIELISETHVNDKVVHFVAYLALAALPVLAFRIRSAVACIMAVEVASIALEFIQLLVPGRSCEVADAVANTAGVLVGALAGWLLRVRLTGFTESKN